MQVRVVLTKYPSCLSVGRSVGQLTVLDVSADTVGSRQGNVVTHGTSFYRSHQLLWRFTIYHETIVTGKKSEVVLVSFDPAANRDYRVLMLLQD